MLPSMPILFTRDSQDAFGNKTEPSTSFFGQNIVCKPIFQPSPSTFITPVPVSTNVQRHNKTITCTKRKDPTPEDHISVDKKTKDAAFVSSYYTRVQSRLASTNRVPSKLFLQFQDILKSYNPSTETPIDLYRKLEFLFGEQHKDLTEDFLLFLTRGQAATVGRFMDHFSLTQMASFIELLQMTFVRKPTMLRKVLRSMTTCLNSGNIVDLKTKVLPHLRSHARLTQMFKALFPDERPPESFNASGTETFGENFMTDDQGYDEWQFEEKRDSKKNLDVKEGLDTRYMQGRVFLQHGKMLRPARVTFPFSKEPYRVHAQRLCPNQCPLSPSHYDDERASPKRTAKKISKNSTKKRTKKTQSKSPMKHTKDVNDNTKVTNSTDSPKSSKAKAQSKSKINTKEKKEAEKVSDVKKEKHKDRNESKYGNDKKDEGSKAKQAKVESVDVKTKYDHTDESKLEDPVSRVDIKVDEPGKKVESKTNWTREEDKTLLQSLASLNGEAITERVFSKIAELLPHRSVADIKDRYLHVMNLLQQMAVGEMT